MAELDTTFSAARWVDPAWQAEALGWVARRLAAAGRQVVGVPEQTRARPWSTVFRVPTDAGAVWFKANNAGTGYEAALARALGGWCPDRVLVPLAVDVDRGWLLLPDGGATLRERQGGRTDLAHWERILAEHADLQRQLRPRVPDLLALGVPDRRPSRLAESRARLLDEGTWLRLGRPGGLTEEQRRRLRGDQARYAGLCAELDSLGIAATLQHDDLHDNNVFAGPDHFLVFDWGDASVGTPFATLLVTLRVVAAAQSLPNGAPELLRLRDAYLEPWTGEHDRSTLLRATELAVRTGGVARALSYRRALQGATQAGLDEYGDGVPVWLLQLYEPTPLDPAS